MRSPIIRLLLSLCSLREEALPLWPVVSDEDARRQTKAAKVEYRLATIHHGATRRARTGSSPVYTYLFDHAVTPERGAPHSSDLPFEFNDPPTGERVWNETDHRVAALVSAYWVNFVKTANPNGDGLPAWPAFAPESPVTMTLGPTPGTCAIASP